MARELINWSLPLVGYNGGMVRYVAPQVVNGQRMHFIQVSGNNGDTWSARIVDDYGCGPNSNRRIARNVSMETPKPERKPLHNDCSEQVGALADRFGSLVHEFREFAKNVNQFIGEFRK